MIQLVNKQNFDNIKMHGTNVKNKNGCSRFGVGGGGGGISWRDLAQDRDRWWRFMNAVMNLLIPQDA